MLLSGFILFLKLIKYIDFGGQASSKVTGANQRMRPKKSGQIILKIDDEMSTMYWLRNFKRKLKPEKLEYRDNEYESSGFDPLNIKIHDSIKDK